MSEACIHWSGEREAFEYTIDGKRRSLLLGYYTLDDNDMQSIELCSLAYRDLKQISSYANTYLFLSYLLLLYTLLFLFTGWTVAHVE